MESLPWWEPFHGPAESTHRVSCWDPSGDRAKSVCLRREFVQPPSFYNLLPSRHLSCCSQAREGTLKCCFCRDFQAFQSLDGMFPTPQEIFGVQAALKTAVCWPCCWLGRGVSNVECKIRRKHLESLLPCCSHCSRGSDLHRETQNVSLDLL